MFKKSYKYKVKMRLPGGATLTKDIVATSEGQASERAIKKFNAVAVMEIKKLGVV